MMGCCADKKCTPETCMNLPNGKTCKDCFWCKRCVSMFGATEIDTACGWFPRRFMKRDLEADDLDGTVSSGLEGAILDGEDSHPGMKCR